MTFRTIFLWFQLAGLLLSSAVHDAGEATFFRAVNLNGPAVTIDGYPWQGDDEKELKATGSSFENQAVPLKPPTDPERAKMIRSSRWGSKIDLEIRNVPEGDYQVLLYVWEDNHNERFDILVNEKPVLEGFQSGNAGSWKRLGPWPATASNGTLKISACGGAANLSGVEIWSGTGEVPSSAAPQFATAPNAEQTEFFERRIRPLLVENCYE